MTTESARALPVWRSILFVPALAERFVDSALRQSADALQIDLEDSIGPDDKARAREAAPAVARRFSQASFDVLVRVNRPWRLLVRDLEAVVASEVLAITLPKVPDAPFVREVAQVIDELERERGLVGGHTRLVAMIESPEGLAHIDAIAAAHPRVVALIIGAEDLALTLQCAVDDEALLAPNQRAVFAARRAGVMPLGFVGSVADYADHDAFRARIERARRLGFDGGFCVHPSQVAVMNEAFAPRPAELARAQALVAAFEAQRAAGRAAFAFEGRMVDLPVVEQARALLARHARIAQRVVRRG
ncbi:MAG: CoA ester lyase [Burkholderiaceae bacterium]|jgi:citrate lyase subunit beta/citryl-CoA lyase|nr:CoA ester lyase [Burkholderiaceae bacterium]